ncbi:hypothetical protein GLW03_12945 [Halobacillus halophilus]|uniref:hypothetical protein n=1 Tax=Halobacillus halophilus TaxID=1570 RepID=UPI00136A5CA5|nr:hypothetical protein [Halobacillus halophilus]MYL30733.1 hypothetical protein [Halobacillus halophilus]
MAKNKVKDYQKQIDKMDDTLIDLENQAKMERSKAQEKRRERYELMADYSKNKDKIMELDKQEKEAWDNVRSLEGFKEELQEEKEKFIDESLKEVVEERRKQEQKVKADMEKVKHDLLEKKLQYLKEVSETMEKAWSKADKDLEDLNDFILQHGNAKKIGQNEYKEKNGRSLLPTAYGKPVAPFYLVDNNDVQHMFSLFTVKLYREFGEVEHDPSKAQKRYRVLKGEIKE